MKSTILCVGNCGFDQSRLNDYLLRRFDATILTADDARGADAILARRTVDLALVNRVFDRDGASGIAWIERQATRAENSEATRNPRRTMLVSGYDDAQRSAVESGADPGFGKQDLSCDVAAERIAAALSRLVETDEANS